MELNVNTAKCLTIVAAAALGMCSSPRAQACGEQWGNRGLAAFGFPALMIESQASPSFAPGLTPSDNQKAQQASIVGMWTVGFYHPGNVLWDNAIEQFSLDGNEMTNDNAFPPAEGNLCWGVWARLGPRKYKMKHIGWVFDANGTYLGRFDFAATLVLNDDGNGFTGKYEADQEDLSGNKILDLHDEGTLRGTRFTVD